MKAKKLLTSIVAGVMLLSLAACGIKSASEGDTTSSVSTSSKVTKKNSSSKKQQVKTVSEDTSSSTSNSSANTNTSSASSSNNGSRSAAPSAASVSSSSNGGSSSSSSATSTATLTQIQARDLLKERLGANLNNAGTAGQSMPVQPTATDVDSFTATQTGTNNYQFTGTVNGKMYTYNVSPTSITEG